MKHVVPATVMASGFSAAAPARLVHILAALFPADQPGLVRQAKLLGEGKLAYVAEFPDTAVHVSQGKGARSRDTESGSRTDKAFANLVFSAAKERGKRCGRTVTFQRLRWFERIDREVLDAIEDSDYETTACLELLAKDKDVERQRALLNSWRAPAPVSHAPSTWCGDRVSGILDNATRFFVPDVFGADGKLLVPSVDFWRNDSRRLLPRLFNAGRCFDLIACDPPFGVARTDSDGRTIIGDGDPCAIASWASRLSLLVLKDDCYAYFGASAEVYSRWVWTGAILPQVRKVDEIVWDKQQPSGLGDPGASLNPFTERFLVAHKGHPKLRPHNAGEGLVQRDSDLWSVRAPRGKGHGDKHPSRKPPQLFERVLLNASDEGDAVLDGFAGCAPCGVAAIRLRRRWVGVEAEPEWFAEGVLWLKDELAAKYPKHFGHIS